MLQYRFSEGSDMHCAAPGTCDSRQIISTDGGASFGRPISVARALTPAYTGVEVGPGLGLQLRWGAHAGRLLFVGHKDKWSSRGTALWTSDDGGDSWKLQHHFPFMNEGQLAELAGGVVFVLLRNNGTNTTAACHCLASALSFDGGVSWRPTRFNSQLRNPGSQAAALGSSDGRVLYVSTDYSSDHSLQGHNNLSLLSSTDMGSSWSRALWSVGPSVQTSYSSLALRGGPAGAALNILYESEVQGGGCQGPSCAIVFRGLSVPPPPPPPPKRELVAYRSVSYGCSHGYATSSHPVRASPLARLTPCLTPCAPHPVGTSASSRASCTTTGLRSPPS